ncbi:hypothetical protein Bca52824_020649 [Brassica carinata]|uniref:Uncharacterized protein n=1 Tax=Brassica carinata TaxID=52824 RepID=A0A8X8B0N3_BRACI|nr:hypothetical protein Bca52824_020649 [Brassica carinata]
MRVRLLKHSPYLLPLRPYDISKQSDLGKRKRLVKPKEELQTENSDELRSLPESETQDEKMSEATTSKHSLSRPSVHEQSLRMAAFSLEKKMPSDKKKKPAPKATVSSN